MNLAYIYGQKLANDLPATGGSFGAGGNAFHYLTGAENATRKAYAADVLSHLMDGTPKNPIHAAHMNDHVAAFTRLLSKRAALDPMHSALRIGLRHGAMGAGAGALIGGAAGAARAEDGHRWQGAARGAAIGGAIGGTIAGVGSGLIQRAHNKDLTRLHAKGVQDVNNHFNNIIEEPGVSAEWIEKNRQRNLGELETGVNAVPRRWTDAVRAVAR